MEGTYEKLVDTPQLGTCSPQFLDLHTTGCRQLRTQETVMSSLWLFCNKGSVWMNSFLFLPLRMNSGPSFYDKYCSSYCFTPFVCLQDLASTLYLEDDFQKDATN
ncbi:hypothetical protein AVEN_130406-1 [Araneus ventricosus]|uniref:Uncharacterized protein n=1 Tax=Araneus ventricosus TaxID=182803 RepID=A0A4Y2BG93_ARAVE|nr:hypothetical protein AVEN_130406-1 [Araneus ventricosus]